MFAAIESAERTTCDPNEIFATFGHRSTAT
jgi:hypothetical protein